MTPCEVFLARHGKTPKQRVTRCSRATFPASSRHWFFLGRSRAALAVITCQSWDEAEPLSQADRGRGRGRGWRESVSLTPSGCSGWNLDVDQIRSLNDLKGRKGVEMLDLDLVVDFGQEHELETASSSYLVLFFECPSMLQTFIHSSQLPNSTQVAYVI